MVASSLRSLPEPDAQPQPQAPVFLMGVVMVVVRRESQQGYAVLAASSFRRCPELHAGLRSHVFKVAVP